MGSSSLKIPAVEGFSNPNRLYTKEIVLKTFFVRENNEPEKPLVFRPKTAGSGRCGQDPKRRFTTRWGADKEHFVLRPQPKN